MVWCSIPSSGHGKMSDIVLVDTTPFIDEFFEDLIHHLSGNVTGRC